MSEIGIYRILGGISLTLALAVYLLVPSQVSMQPIPGTGDLVGITPGTIPLACSTAFAVIGVMFVASSFSGSLQGPASAAKLIEREALPRLSFTVAMLLAYVFTMEFLGYLLATILFLLSLNLFFGTRGARQLAIAAIAVPIAIFLFFGRVMLIPLPEGILAN